MQIIEIPTPTKTVQAKVHRRKSSRRWQKKWQKRFGMKVIVLPHNAEDILVDEARDIAYAYPVMFRRLQRELRGW